MIEAAKYDDMVDTQSPCPYASIYKECCEQSMDPAWKLPEGERASGNGSKHRFRAKMAIRPKKANPTDGKEVSNNSWQTRCMSAVSQSL